jgi:hypothetical protein
VKISEWDLGLPTRVLEDLKGVLELVSDMKKRGVEGAAVARSFCRRMIQPIKDWSTRRMNTVGNQIPHAR